MTAPVAYMERTRLFYEAQGFDVPYQYAQHASTPFSALEKPLAESKLALITTASQYFREELEPRKVDFGDSASLPAELFADDLSWDKEATHLKDLNAFFPLATLHALADDNTIGSVAPRFACAPTEYSQRATIEQDAPTILKQLQGDAVDVALLVPL